MAATDKIMVPLDGSTRAEEALDVAIEIVKPAGGSLILFVAAEPAASAALSDYADSEDVNPATAADAYLDQVVGRLQSRGVTAVKTSSDGTNAAVEIVDRATAEEVSMIVMTSHGRSGVGRWRLGSVADKVARSATVPVVIVPCEERG